MSRAKVIACAALCLFSTAAACALPPLDLSKDEDIGKLYRRRCATCHTLPNPAEYARWEWPMILDEYGPMSGLTDLERRALEPWLLARADKSED